MQDATKLQRFFQSKRPLLLILGNHAANRTHLLEQAGTTATPDQMVLRIKARTTCSTASLTELFKKHWAVTISQTSAHLNDQLNEILDCLTQRKQSCLLLIDNAHLLPIEVLTALCHLSHQQEHQLISIRIILAGYSELASKIHALHSKQFSHPQAIHLTHAKAIENITEIDTISAPIPTKQSLYKHAIKSIAAVSIFSIGFLWWHLQDISHSNNLAQTTINQLQDKANEDIFVS